MADNFYKELGFIGRRATVSFIGHDGTQFQFAHVNAGGSLRSAIYLYDLDTLEERPVSDADFAGGGGGGADVVGIKNASDTRINPATETTLVSIDGKISSCNTSTLALETGGNLANLAGKDFATESSLSSLNSKIIACDTSSINGATYDDAVLNILSRILRVLKYPGWLDRSANAIRNQVQSGTITAVTTVTTVSNLTNFGTLAADTTVRMNSRLTWANTVRKCIS